MGFRKTGNALKILVTGFVLTLANSLSAATFVVDDNYDGINNASACEQPAGASFFSNITNARLAAATNTLALPHTIRICPGTYTEDNTFNDPEFIGMTIEGTTSNPADVQINGVDPAGSVIFLRQNKMTLRNVNIYGGRYGVRSLTSDSTVLDNLILNKQDYDGIIIQSSDNRITNTVIENVGRMGIFFTSSLTTVETLLIESTKVLSVSRDCINSNRGNITLLDVTVDTCGRYGAIFNKATGLSENLSISNLSVNNATSDGLYIRNYNASAATDTVEVDNVQITNAARFGTYLVANDSINLSNIKIDQTVNDGIVFNNTANSIFNDISINNAGDDGLSFNATSTKNQLQAISISNSKTFGFRNNGGDDNTIEKLSISDSNGTYGIYYGNQAENNVIKEYEIYRNNYGISLTNSQANTFAYGKIYANNYGVRLTGSSAKNEFIDNYIHDNSILGLSISASGANESNAFYRNCFINPADNINNAETGAVNSFDNGSIGNFYGSSPAGSGYSETCLDSDTNAICDASYTIPGASPDQDNFPSRDLTTIDAACFSDAVALPNINFKKTSQVVSDPVNGTSNPKAIPGAIVAYTLTVTNSGIGNSDNNTVAIIDNLPAQTKLVLGSSPNPIVFADGTPSSGLSYTFSGLSSTTDDIEFSNDGGATFITPSVDIDGVDISSPHINFIKIIPKGVLNGDSGSGTPYFTMTYRVQVN
ncbi:right-handed parallel beta-helix repeat-containing protein [uncultured Cocleimonas sp.]|uniref:right-handed parallel beta-helix repeat-containing protein n=1 Tax=uncultured Cocleimonas sp. TaxID=1051587 RepID=UPI002636B499|nr:right-handed parallel beta-helix repeat-containing protein [uncultured Cocleimonas sp.]